MRVFVTGGCGYVGRALTRGLLGDHEVMVFDLLRHGRPRFTPAERDQFTLVTGDIRDFGSVKKAFAAFSPEVVIHLAAIHYIPECEKSPDEAIGINTLGTANVVRACDPGTRVVFTSSAAVYSPDTAPHTEASQLGPIDVYGLTKLHAEQLVHHWARARELDCVVARLFNVVGPGETNPHIAPTILAQVRRGTRRLRLGNLHPRRDYIHVRDVVGALALLASVSINGSGPVTTLNLGSGTSHSVRELVGVFSGVLGVELLVQEDERRTRRVDRPFLAADLSWISECYSWRPSLTLEEAIRELCSDPDMPDELLARC